jgi:hypothetical protein
MVYAEYNICYKVRGLGERYEHKVVRHSANYPFLLYYVSEYGAIENVATYFINIQCL